MYPTCVISFDLVRVCLFIFNSPQTYNSPTCVSIDISTLQRDRRKPQKLSKQPAKQNSTSNLNQKRGVILKHKR